MRSILLKTILLSSLLSSFTYADDLFDEDLESILGMESELQADLGSRNGGQDITKALSPVDVVTYDQIEKSGLTSLVDVLRYFISGFNAPETSVADGSDHVRAYTLRGMSPDQILVLINGKRRHTSSLLHVNGTIGRGSSHVDLDAIPVISIEKVEVLRDGAAAQYGSDAISGVINIILKGDGHDSTVRTHLGIRKEGDGEQVQADTFISEPLDYDGFVNLSIEAKNQNSTQRAGLDDRVTPATQTTNVGIPKAKSILAALNIEVPQENGLDIYLHATTSYKESQSDAFYRPDDNGTNTYPNGFTPRISLDILDVGTTIGVKGEIGDGYFWDLSNTFGYNRIEYGVDNSVNFSNPTQTSFDNGSTSFLQNTTNLDLVKNISDFKLAGGLEARYEEYQIKAGDPLSYFGSGAQGLAGFSPNNEVRAARENISIYFDGTYDVAEGFVAELATRYEYYADFGSTLNVKLALGYRATENLLFRSSFSTGFRAPSLTQEYYTQTSSFVDGTGNLGQQATLTYEDPLALANGAKELEVETSKHLNIGSIYKLGQNSDISFDFYYVLVDDRIMLSDEIVVTDPNIDRIRFFTNAVDTSTQGVDIKARHLEEFENDSSLLLSAWFNYNKNKVTKYNDSNIINEANSFEQIDRLENGQPKTSLKLLSSYSIEKWAWTMNISRWGEYQQVRNDVAYKFDAQWTTDMDILYKLNDDIDIAVGGVNVFNAIPNQWDGLTGDEFYGAGKTKSYSRYSPFGYSGAYYYIRASIDF